MISKGRDNRNNQPKGEDNCNAKMTEEKVIALRWDYIAGMSRNDLATKYELRPQSVPDLIGGRSWRHITGGPTMDQLRAARRFKVGAKLSREQAISIRARLDVGESASAIATEFNMNASTILDIKHRRTWRDL